MKIANTALHDLVRLGGIGSINTEGELTLDTLEWPKGRFGVPVGRYRQLLIELGALGLDDYSDEELKFVMPHYVNLKFIDQHDWALDYENVFVGVSDEIYFAYNDYGFFFLKDDPRDPGFPLVLYVDHECSSEVPDTFDYRLDLTLPLLLQLLEPE